MNNRFEQYRGNLCSVLTQGKPASAIECYYCECYGVLSRTKCIYSLELAVSISFWRCFNFPANQSSQWVQIAKQKMPISQHFRPQLCGFPFIENIIHCKWQRNCIWSWLNFYWRFSSHKVSWRNCSWLFCCAGGQVENTVQMIINWVLCQVNTAVMCSSCLLWPSEGVWRQFKIIADCVVKNPMTWTEISSSYSR